MAQFACVTDRLVVTSADYIVISGNGDDGVKVQQVGGVGASSCVYSCQIFDRT